MPVTLAGLSDHVAARHGAAPAVRFRDPAAPEGWAVRDYATLGADCATAGEVLRGLGVRPGDRVAVIGETRYAWTVTHLGALRIGAVIVPVYPTAGPEELCWVLSDSGATVAVCDDEDRAERVRDLRGRFPALREVVVMAALTDPAGGPVPPGPAAEPHPDAEAALVYTSGTTGPPKGCRLSHGNFTAVQRASVPLVVSEPGDRTYLYLPLAHLLAQMIQFTTLLKGGELAYFGGRVEDVIGELAEVSPTHLPSVPRLFEKVHAVVAGLAAGSEGGSERLAEAVRVGVLKAEGEELTKTERETWQSAEDGLYGLVRAAFGGRLRWATTGGAPIAIETLDLLRACGIRVFEGYGMTESGGLITLNHPGAVRYGTVGRPVEGCEVRIAEDGEVLARGPMVFGGYHANPTATDETLDGEGWLRTGDLGTLDEDGFLRITGRKKELIITSAGKNITPTEVEFAVQRARLVSRAVLVGDRRPYPVALITLDEAELAGWAKETGTEVGNRPANHPAVRAEVERAVTEANERVARPARIRAFAILDEEFTVAAGTLTPTLKLRRAEILRRYAERVEALYATGPKPDATP
ncbi:AMP-dependent synthetase/ligase [Streptomyces sp. BI20]|uniref:AMP-dependent synthetase/ligase n=1 Tax=Streptomyces sp. BI20 TaxID=3403460 RepID=UPI003C789E22